MTFIVKLLFVLIVGQRFSNWEARTVLREGANGNQKPSCWAILRGLPAGLLLGEVRMLTIILKGGVETQSLKTTSVGYVV